MVDLGGEHRVKRGEIWTIAGGPDYAGKPRPAIILQSDKFDATRSIAICPLTGTPVDADPARFTVAPSPANGLQVISYAMVDKVSTIPKSKMRRRVGKLDSADVSLFNQRVALFLGLAE
jgi:mRNA interferase MazF